MIISLEEIAKTSIHPILKACGFKKKGLQWNRNRGDYIDVITIQEAGYSDTEKTMFTINLGIFVKSFYEAVWQKAQRGFVNEADCVIRLRLSDLLQSKHYGDAKDEWIEIDIDNHQSVLEDISECLVAICMPFFDKIETPYKILEHMNLTQGGINKTPLMSIYKALANWKTGSNHKALEVLSTVKAKAWASKIKLVQDEIEGSGV